MIRFMVLTDDGSKASFGNEEKYPRICISKRALVFQSNWMVVIVTALCVLGRVECQIEGWPVIGNPDATFVWP